MRVRCLLKLLNLSYGALDLLGQIQRGGDLCTLGLVVGRCQLRLQVGNTVRHTRGSTIDFTALIRSIGSLLGSGSHRPGGTPEIEGQLQRGQRGLKESIAWEDVVGIGGNLLESENP